MKWLNSVLPAMISSLVVVAAAAATEQTSLVTVDENGTVRISDLAVPLSAYMSEEAKSALIAYTQAPFDPAWADPNSTIEKLRKLDEMELKELVDSTKARYPVDIKVREIGGVRTREVTPKSGVARQNKHKVLIELHGGGFFTGAYGQAMLESIPVAAEAGYKVIAVDYRQGPEHQFPAASEDVAAVYKELLKEYEPSNIGIYGCSAGGSLAAMAVAWFQKEELPKPGAIGIFNAAAYAGFLAPPNDPGAWGGDSRYYAPALIGEPPWPLNSSDFPMPAVTTVYLQDADLQSPLASPALHPEVLAEFPPTLVVSSTRAFDMSAAVQTHREMVKAGVDTDLHVWDGVGHCFFSDASLPESQEFFSVVKKFFDQRLGR